MKYFKYFIIILAAFIFVVLYYQGATKHAETLNTNYRLHDQGAYLYYAQQLHDTHYQYTGRRNRHPLYPGILSFFYKTGMSLDDYFVRGKQLNIIFSIFFLAAIFIVFYKFFRRHTAINLFFITAFTVFIFKAPYFQCELLYYFLAFFTFLLILKMFTAPTWYYAVLTGVFTGLTYLTKASVMPALGLLAIWLTAKEALKLLSRIKNRVVQPVDIKSLLLPFVSIALVVITFLIVVYPYISTSKRIFGKYFYNVNSTFYMWYDSREEMKSGTRAHGDREGWPDMAPEMIPSPKKYFQEHSIGQVFNRVWTGAVTSLKANKHAYGYFWYLFYYLIYFLLLVLINLKKSVELAKEHIFLFLFLISYFGVYFGLNAWWNYLGPSVRHILAIFLPFMFIVNYIVTLLPEKTLNIWRYQVSFEKVFNVFISIMLIYDIYTILTFRLITIMAGD
ncbi:hypothetical protein JXQ31_11675 [candidate division KSB1 bacterium]|nr:hypothetical protein [candidate division KSB1 bacterium]